MTFGVQTTKTPTVTWGWFFDSKAKAIILAEDPALIVTFNNATEVNNKNVSGPGPHLRHFTYTYHASIHKLGGKKSKRLRFGDHVEIRNNVAGEGANLRVSGNLQYTCNVRGAGPPY